MRTVVLSFLLAWMTLTLQAQPAPWKLKKSSDGVEVYYRKLETSPINEIKIKTTLPGTVESLLSIMRHVPGYTRWVYKCTTAELLERVSRNEALYYGVMDFPWPLSDRDFIARSKTTVSPEGKIIIEVKGHPDILPVKQALVRIPLLDYRWEFTPTENGAIHLEYHLRSDPGGALPAWAVNAGLDQGPTQTVKNLRELLRQKEQAQNRATLKD